MLIPAVPGRAVRGVDSIHARCMDVEPAARAAIAVGGKRDGGSILRIAENRHETPRLPRPTTPRWGGPANFDLFVTSTRRCRSGSVHSIRRIGVRIEWWRRRRPVVRLRPAPGRLHWRPRIPGSAPLGGDPIVGGRQCLLRPVPAQSNRSVMLRSPSDRRSSRPDGWANTPKGRRRQEWTGDNRLRGSNSTREPTRTFQTRGDRTGRRTTRHRGISPAGRTHPAFRRSST